MKKKFVSLITILTMLMAFMPQVHVNAAAISAEEMRQKFNELRVKYPENSTWNGSYNNLSWQCMGWAETVCDYLFGENPRNWVKQTNYDNLCVGDHVRINNNGHSIVITNMIGNTIYYADCNWSYDNKVHWDKTMTRSELISKATWFKSQPDNWVRTLETDTTTTPAPTYQAIHKDTTAHVANGIYTFKNARSGKMMNVYAGDDYNGNKVTIWEYDGTVDQRFRVEHNGSGKYFVYAMCSSNGNGRVLDILRENSETNGDLKNGCWADIYDKNDSEAQLFYIYPIGDGKYVFELASRDGRVLSAVNVTGSKTDGSHLMLKDYTGELFEQWYLCDVNGVRIDRAITGINIKTLPSKTTYYTNETLATEGLLLTATYNDGSTEEISSGYDIIYNFTTPGTKTVTVTYKQKSTTFNVNVIEPKFEITNIQSQNINTNKFITADVNRSDIICYLAAYTDGRLVECDIEQPTNGKIELCISGNYDKYIFMVWDLNMKPLMNTRFIY